LGNWQRGGQPFEAVTAIGGVGDGRPDMQHVVEHDRDVESEAGNVIGGVDQQ
jgi:hypothetical protein